MEKVQYPWSVPVAVEDIPETGLHVEVEPAAEIRSELARLAGLRELPRLSGTFDLTRRGSGVRLVGDVNARVGQTCVVTLDPIENDVNEHIDLVFVPVSDAAGAAGSSSGDEEPPERLVDGRLDLGAVATEFLLLGIDPYPRKAGAKFAAVAPRDASAKPFAALEALKKRMSGG
ncbi:MAG TPA: DUF177 domain-containing protein [Pseudolabrys sp.]|nr:DUF177 domain-containing protein [Pseudolabrys sp.]